MDTIEFKRILEVIDKEIDQAKSDWEAKAKREQVEQRKRLLLHWRQGLESRKTEFAKYGAKPSIDLEGKLMEIQKEIEEIEAQLLPKEPAPLPAPAVLASSVKAEIQELINEINRTGGILEWPPGERVLRLQEWAIRWKMAGLQAGEGVVDREPIFKVAYAAILNMRDAAAKDTPLAAMSRTPGTPEGWASALATVRARQAEAMRARHEQERLEKASDDAFGELSIFVQSALLDGEESLKTFRHLVRKAASFEHLRPEVAELCAKHRTVLEPEFAFLWGGSKDEEPEEPAKKLSNRMVIGRICRRLKSKGMIGACHAPYDMVTQGFAGHDYGRSEEAIDILVKGGVVRRRRTGVGVRVSLEPSMMQAVDAAIDGKSTGIAAVDEWTAKEP